MGRTTIPKPVHGSLEWLQARHRSDDGRPIISASEAAACHGEHRFTTKYQLGVNKLQAEPVVTETTAAMERGNRLEPVLIEWVADLLGVALVSPDVMYRYDADGILMSATLDAIAGNPSDPELVVEIKTYNRVFDPTADLEGYGPLPAYWYWQGVQQAMCAGVDSIVWGVFDSQLKLHLYNQEVSSYARLAHKDAVYQFLEVIRHGDVPGDWAQTYEDVKHIPAAPGETADLADVRQQIAELAEVQTEMKTLKAREDHLRAVICAELGTATVGLIDGNEVVTWKAQVRKSFDTKRFEAEHPELAAEYQTETAFRVLRSK